MRAIADTSRLVADGVITPEQASEIETRARQGMVTLAINSVLCAGILAATGGLIFWLSDALAVAFSGGLALALGLAILLRGSALYGMFGNAATLIGAGMLIGGGCVELLNKAPDIASEGMAVAGMLLCLALALPLLRGIARGRYVVGAVFVMGAALHLAGMAMLLQDAGVTGLPRALFFLYASATIALTGWLVDIGLITAFAIVPFAQVLDTGTMYFHAIYVFHSPEPTLSILQMAGTIALLLWASARLPERGAGHVMILVMLAFVVANLCALVGSLWGDTVGETYFRPHPDWYSSSEHYEAELQTYLAQAWTIPAEAYAVLWALALAALVFWAGFDNRRGLFNAALTFAAIHLYTQLYESFGNEPLAYVIGGLLAIPLAWGMWRLDGWISARKAAVDADTSPAG